MLPIREGAGASGLRRRLSALLLRSSGVDCAVVKPVLRVGRSIGDTKPSRTGRSRSLVRLCARAWLCSRAISARHGKNTRKALTRLRRPVAGPDITAEELQRNQVHADEFQGRVRPSPKSSLMELKQLWLM